MQACDAETAKQGQAYYAALAANGPTAGKAPAGKAPSRPSSAKPPALSSNVTAAQVRYGTVAIAERLVRNRVENQLVVSFLSQSRVHTGMLQHL